MVMVAVLGLSANAWAQCCKSVKGTKTAQANGAKSCCQSAAMKKATCSKNGTNCANACCAMPTMTYRVGQESLSCPKSAETMAKDNDQPLTYLVGQKEFSDKGKANDAYAVALEEYLTKVAKVCYRVGDKCVQCPMEAKSLAQKDSGQVKYCVGSYVFDDQAKAEQAAKMASEAAGQVKMAMNVDGQSYSCPKEAQQASEKTGKTCQYKVGECKTECKSTAQVELSKARIEAARKAIETHYGA